MNIYLVTRNDDWGYDEYDSCICYANNEDEAYFQLLSIQELKEGATIKLIG